MASLRNVPFSLVQSLCPLVKVIYQLGNTQTWTRFFSIRNPHPLAATELTTVVVKHQEKALDTEGRGGKPAKAGGREPENKISVHVGTWVGQ